MQQQTSIRSQLVTLVAAVALPLAAFGAWSIHTAYRDGSRQAEHGALDTARMTALAAHQALMDGRDVLLRISDRPAVRSLDPEKCDPWIAEANGLLDQFANVFVVDGEGRFVCSAVPPPDTLNARGADWFEGALSRRAFLIGKPRVGRITQTWVVVLANPVLNDEGEVSAVVGLPMVLSRIQGLVEAVPLPENGIVSVTDADGTVLARSSDAETWVGRTIPPSGLSEMILSNEFGITRTKDLGGLERVWGFARVPDTDWRIYAGLPTNSIYATVRKGAASNVAIALGIMLLVTTIATIQYRRLSGSFLALVEATRESEGSAGLTVPPGSPIELAEVAEQFNRTLAARTRAEQRAVAVRERYRSIFHNAVFGLYVSTPEGRFLEVNPALVRMLGFDDAEELVSRDVATLYRNPERRIELVERHRSSGAFEGLEVEWLRKDGSTITVRLSGTTFEDDQGRVRFEVICEDVTERRLLEAQVRQAQKMEAVGRLAGGVAHDFNNLLTVINGQAQLLLEDLPSGTGTRRSAEEIVESGRRAAALTGQLLAFSRKQVIRAQAVDVNLLIQNLDKMLRRLIQEDVDVRVELGRGVEPALADPGQLEQIILNLALNSQDAMPGGGTLVIETANAHLDESYVRSHVGVAPGSYVRLTVSDTGHGMTPEIQAQVFEPFFTTKGAGKGTGLGLSTVYGIVTQSGGHIQLYSKPGLGTTFSIYLPVAGEEARAGTAHTPDTDAVRGGSETVLVVEDEQAVRGVVCHALRRGGYHVIEADSGAAGLSAARAHHGPVHLLLTDVVMPGMKGPELAAALSLERPEMSVLFMSGYTDNLDLRLSIEGPAAGFIPKPFTPTEILRKVKEVLRPRAA